ncbi:MAG: ATP-binding protein [Acidobacteriota bacterium]|nr:ATP-binding protein [Acidobacteriota bacterium]
MRLRHKLLLTMAAAGLLTSVLVAAGAAWLIRSAVRENFTDRIRAETALLAAWVDADPESDPQDFAERAARRLGLRVTLITADGTVIADSARGREGVVEMDNHLGRPEVEQALLTGSGQSFRTSATTRIEYFYSAHRVEGEGPVRFARVALPSSQVQAVQSRYVWLVAGVVVVAMMVMVIIAYASVRRLSKPVEWMADAAERAAGGDLEIEISRYGEAEIARLAVAVNRMKQALVEKIAELETEQERLASVVSGMREGLLLVGPDRRIRIANAAIRQIFLLPTDPVGHLVAEVIRHPAVIEEVETALAEHREIGETVLRMDGAGRSFELHVTPLGEPGTSSHGVLVLLFDITRLERLEDVRRSFVANVSHELRTPLTSIKAFVETLRDDELSDRDNAVRFLEIIQKHTDRMGALIDDLTDLSLIETGSISLEMQRVDAREVVEDVTEQLEALAESRGVEIVVGMPSGFFVRADRRRLEQVLTNLVENAIKFNRDGGSVRIEGRMQDGRPEITIADDGPGIPADHQQRIFHRFHRVDKDRSREAGGTGLGLAIVKHLVRLHGGQVRLDSELGHGSRFTIELPAVGVSA